MNTRIILIAIAAVAAALGGAWWAASQTPHKHELTERKDAQGKSYWTCAMHPEVRTDGPGNCPICGMSLIQRSDEPAAQREVLYWYDPMRPDVQFDAPGRSPFMDMDLVPKYADEGGATVIEIAPGMVQNLGIRTARVDRGTFWQRVDTVGSVDFDPHRKTVIEARAEGWLAQLSVHAEGEQVRRGQVVATLDSPMLGAARQEYRLALESSDEGLIRAAAARLQRLGLDAEAQSEKRSNPALVPLRAPVSGVVTRIDVHAGARVGPKMPLMQIADLSRVWVTVEVPEAQLAWIRAGRPAEVRLPALPGEVLEAPIDYVFPQIDPATRTGRVRLILDNPDGRLQPGMVANVVLFGGARREVLLVPSEAVIQTGERSVVIVDLGEGRYAPQAVVVGAQRAGQTIIESGLDEGTSVVVSGQFLIDSEASLRGAYRRLGEGGGS